MQQSLNTSMSREKFILITGKEDIESYNEYLDDYMDRSRQFDKEKRDSQEQRLINSKEDGWGCVSIIAFILIGIIVTVFENS